jgi:dethiobiotin synthetase
MTQVLNPDLVVLVAPNRLGVLHDVGSTLRAMQHHGQPPDLVVLNNTMPLDASSDSNASLLRRLYPRQVFAELGHSDPESAATLLQRIRESVAARKSSS